MGAGGSRIFRDNAPGDQSLQSFREGQRFEIRLGEKLRAAVADGQSLRIFRQQGCAVVLANLVAVGELVPISFQIADPHQILKERVGLRKQSYPVIDADGVADDVIIKMAVCRVGDRGIHGGPPGVRQHQPVSRLIWI